MTEVWKSQAKKFCQICKCWFADNKASIDFHEKGDRHKNALARSLRENSKQQERDARQQASLNSTLALMESSALASMKNDKASSSSTSFFDPRNFKDIRSMAWELGKRAGPVISSGNDEPETKVPKVEDMSAYDARFEGKVWVEAEGDYGRKYYFHMTSGETTWTKPATFFTSEQYDAILNGRDPDEVNDTVGESGPEKKKKKRKPRHRHEIEKKPEVDLDSLNLPKLEPFKKNTEFLVPQILVPSANNDLPKVQHFQPGQKSTIRIKSEELDEDAEEAAPVSQEPFAEQFIESNPLIEHSTTDVKKEVSSQVIHVDGAVLKIEPEAPGAQLVEEIRRKKYEAPALGQWTKVIKDESEVCNESPLTAKYREAEAKEEAEREAKEKLEERFEPRQEFKEKVAETITKKVKGPIEFKKKSGSRNIRKREG